MDRIVSLFEKMMIAMSPRSGLHRSWNEDRFKLVVARSAIVTALELSSIEDKFLQVLTKYASEFSEALKE
ncbi:unnamed protein product, partial [Cylicostephanus goldi]